MRGKKNDANNKEYGTYHCFICQKRYNGPRNRRYNALKQHGKKQHGEDSGFICENLDCHFKDKKGHKGYKIVPGKPKMIWALELKQMHEATYKKEKPENKVPAIPDERKKFKCEVCPKTHRGFVDKKSRILHMRTFHGLPRPSDCKKTSREPKSKKAPKKILYENGKFTICKFMQ